MLKILFAVICILYVISAAAYWCFQKHWGTVGLSCIAAYITAAAYLFLMSTYLFESGLFFDIILFVLLIIFLASSFFCERILFLDRAAQLFLSGTLLFFNILLLCYAALLLHWNTITPGHLLYVCLSVGISTGIPAGFLFESAWVRFNTRCFYLYEQLLKLFGGLLVSIFIIYMLYRFRNMSVPAFLLSFLFSFWCCGLYPVFIKKIQHYEYKR